jgi:hypothetical protein
MWWRGKLLDISGQEVYTFFLDPLRVRTCTLEGREFKAELQHDGKLTVVLQDRESSHTDDRYVLEDGKFVYIGRLWEKPIAWFCELEPQGSRVRSFSERRHRGPQETLDTAPVAARTRLGLMDHQKYLRWTNQLKKQERNRRRKL